MSWTHLPALHWGDEAFSLRSQRPHLLLHPIHLPFHIHQTASSYQKPLKDLDIVSCGHDQLLRIDAELSEKLGDADCRVRLWKRQFG